MFKLKFLSLLLVLTIVSCTNISKNEDQNEFVSVRNGLFFRNGKPYYYVGANMWYGAILASECVGGNRTRLLQELDSLKAVGIDNLRILVGADGKQGVSAKVEPTLQITPGVYNDTILDGLDFLLSEMKKRDMLAVLYLNNSWEWSGGYGQYMEWAGAGDIPQPSVVGYGKYIEYAGQFINTPKAQEIFAEHVKFIVSRTNRYTDVAYKDDPTIMSWQIGNEPRAFSEANKANFALWMKSVSALIKSLDSNHLVSTGSEGEKGCEGDMSLFEEIHGDKNIDYINIHIWPKNWGWISENINDSTLNVAKVETKKYIDNHLVVAEKLSKPVVLEEFGFPRDNYQLAKNSSVYYRDSYYKYVFNLIEEHAKNKRLFAGCNFWAWGGLAEISLDRENWQPGDDYTGDPAQEPQGLNSVFASDLSTLNIIKEASKVLSSLSN